MSQTYSLVSLQSCFSQACLTSDQTDVPFHLQFGSERDKQDLRFSLGLALSWRACGISLGSNICTLYPLTRSFWAEILKKLAANLHPSARFGLSVLPSLKGLMANCRSLVGWWGCRVYSCVVISDAVTLLLTMPIATLRAR